MRSYILITNQGFTESPRNNQIENQQILGYAEGRTKEEAIDNLLNENPEIIQFGFEKSEIIAKELKLA